MENQYVPTLYNIPNESTHNQPIMRVAIIIIASLLFLGQTFGQTENHMNHVLSPKTKQVEMTGKVISTYYAASKQGKPVFINLNEHFPNNKVTIVIYQDYRQNFPDMMELEGKEVIIKGIMSAPYNGKPFIILKYPEQLEIVKKVIP